MACLQIDDTPTHLTIKAKIGILGIGLPGTYTETYCKDPPVAAAADGGTAAGADCTSNRMRRDFRLGRSLTSAHFTSRGELVLM